MFYKPLFNSRIYFNLVRVIDVRLTLKYLRHTRVPNRSTSPMSPMAHREACPTRSLHSVTILYEQKSPALKVSRELSKHRKEIFVKMCNVILKFVKRQRWALANIALTESRRHKCDECGQCFARSRYLSRH